MTEEAFEKSLVDGSQLVAVLLVFLSVLFGVKYEKIIRILGRELPDFLQADQRSSYRAAIKHCLAVDVLPLTVPSLLLAALLAPPTYQILTRSKLTYADLDLVRTIFVFVEVFTVLAALWSLSVACRLTAALRKAA